MPEPYRSQMSTLGQAVFQSTLEQALAEIRPQVPHTIGAQTQMSLAAFAIAQELAKLAALEVGAEVLPWAEWPERFRQRCLAFAEGTVKFFLDQDDIVAAADADVMAALMLDGLSSEHLATAERAMTIYRDSILAALKA